MSTHEVTHLTTHETFHRHPTLVNTNAKPRTWSQDSNPAIDHFHRQLPDYGPTPLHPLPSVAKELGFAHVFLKDESFRFGLPSFKILGASWAIHQMLCQHLDLPADTALTALAAALETRTDVRIVTTTEGNWGRACSRMGKLLGVPVKVYVPWFMNDYVRGLIEGEGAEVVKLEDGSYDDCLDRVRADAEAWRGLMVLDTSWEGFTQIPQWVTDGYATLLHETSSQLAAQTGTLNPPVLAFASVGVGSWAHAVTTHFLSLNPSPSNTITPQDQNQIFTTEPTASPSFKESLHLNALSPIATAETIMNGMCCGTTSTLAWPILRDGVTAAVTVTEQESHECVKELKGMGLDAGPCGAANLAALRKVCAEGLVGGEEERGKKSVVLFSTEGGREYEVPK